MPDRVTSKVVFSDPVHFFAFGFGSGLSPKAPGTAGTLASLPLVMVMMHTSIQVYLVLVLVMSLVGVYLCGESARRLGAHDYPGIVWDEFAGMAITMTAIPFSWINLLLGFGLFRLLDIIKPWPIRVADRRVSGGFGIMLDDILAGLFACILLHGISRLV